MEKLVQQLIEKHNLKKSDAIAAIRIVTDFLKMENPDLKELIDNLIIEKLRDQDGLSNNK